MRVSVPALRRPLLALLIGLCATASSSCSSESPTAPLRQDLANAEALWKSTGLVNYTMEQRRTCKCDGSMHARLFVTNGQISGGSDLDWATELPASATTGFRTAADLFGLIRTTLDNKGTSLRVSFDPGNGFPVLVTVDPSVYADDDVVTYSTSNITAR